MAGGIAVGLALPAFEAAIAVACVFFFASGLIAGLWALLPLVAPRRETLGATSGIVTQVTLFGVLFGPPAAFAVQGGGWTGEMMNIAIACAAMLLLLWLVVSKFNSGARAAVGEPLQLGH
jgi:hypothetical protein